MQDTTEYFYCPLVANIYDRDEYGNMEDYPGEYDGGYLAPYEERIRDLIRLEDARDEGNLAVYFDGSNGAVGLQRELVSRWALRSGLRTAIRKEKKWIRRLNTPKKALVCIGKMKEGPNELVVLLDIADDTFGEMDRLETYKSINRTLGRWQEKYEGFLNEQGQSFTQSM